MSKGSNQGFTLEVGNKVFVPREAYVQVPRSQAKKAGATLELVAFLEEVAFSHQERAARRRGDHVPQRFRFVTRDGKCRGLKCFIPREALGQECQVVMNFTSNRRQYVREFTSVAMELPERAQRYIKLYMEVEEPDSRGASMVHTE